jgi:hypothetical protein
MSLPMTFLSYPALVVNSKSDLWCDIRTYAVSGSSSARRFVEKPRGSVDLLREKASVDDSSIYKRSLKPWFSSNLSIRRSRSKVLKRRTILYENSSFY